MRRQIGSWLLAVFFVFCWIQSTAALEQVQRGTRGVSWRYAPGEGVTPAQLQELLERTDPDARQSLPEATLWSEEQGMAATERGDAHVRAYRVVGDAQRLLRYPVLAGAYPQRADAQGCAVDRETAEALWGSADVLGRTLTCAGRRYVVRGILDCRDPTVVLQGEAEDALTRYRGVQLQFARGASLSESLSAFRSTAELPAPERELLLEVLYRPAALLCALPGAVLLLALLAVLCRGYRYLAPSPLLAVPYCCAALAWLCGAAWVSGLFSPIPADLVPNRWSDFSFWGARLRECAEQLELFLSGQLSAVDRALLGAAVYAMLMGLLAGFAAVLLLGRTRAYPPGRLAPAAAGYWAVVYGCALLLYRQGELPRLPWAVWLLPVCCLAAQLAVQRILAQPKIQGTVPKPRGERPHEIPTSDTP